MSIVVNVDNFRRAETNRMLAGLLARTGGLGSWHHDRALSPLDEQTVIRQNRDTLYGVVIVDISHGVTLTVPDAGRRYLSVMVVNQDHYINRVIHEAGDHDLTVDEFDTLYVADGSRLALAKLGNPASPEPNSRTRPWSMSSPSVWNAIAPRTDRVVTRKACRQSPRVSSDGRLTQVPPEFVIAADRERRSRVLVVDELGHRPHQRMMPLRSSRKRSSSNNASTRSSFGGHQQRLSHSNSSHDVG